MKKEVAEIFENYGNVEVRDNYSGRGMFGRICYGIVCDEYEFFETLGNIMVDGTEEEREEVAEYISNIKRDNMGLDMIYY